MTNIALIGASNNPEKFGNKILLDLISKGYVVYPINPNAEYINELKVFKSILDISDNIDVFNFVIPPKVTLQILKEYKKFLLNKYLWFQPGSSDTEVEEYLKKNNFSNYKINSCIMVNKI